MTEDGSIIGTAGASKDPSPTAHTTRFRPNAGLPVGVAALVIGCAFGGFVLLAQRAFSYPWDILGNSAALWAVLAFAIGFHVAQPFASASSAVAALICGLVTYYAAAVVFLGGPVADLTSRAAVFWYAAGLVVGALGGLAGAWGAQTRHRGRLVTGWALPVALLCSESAVRMSAHGDGTGRWPAVLLASLAGLILSTAVVSLNRRDHRRTVPPLIGTAVALSALGWGLYRLIGLRHAP